MRRSLCRIESTRSARQLALLFKFTEAMAGPGWAVADGCVLDEVVVVGGIIMIHHHWEVVGVLCWSVAGVLRPSVG